MRVVALLFTLYISLPFSYASDILPMDSNIEIEKALSSLLQSKLNLESALIQRGDDPLDVRVFTEFGNDKGLNGLRVVVITDTFVIGRDTSGRLTSQSISISSVTNTKINLEDELTLLRWINKWNSNALPSKLHFDGQNIIIGTNLITKHETPLSHEEYLTAFTNTVKLWPLIVKELSDAGLVVVGG